MTPRPTTQPTHRLEGSSEEELVWFQQRSVVQAAALWLTAGEVGSSSCSRAQEYRGPAERRAAQWPAPDGTTHHQRERPHRDRARPPPRCSRWETAHSWCDKTRAWRWRAKRRPKSRCFACSAVPWPVCEGEVPTSRSPCPLLPPVSGAPGCTPRRLQTRTTAVTFAIATAWLTCQQAAHPWSASRSTASHSGPNPPRAMANC